MLWPHVTEITVYKSPIESSAITTYHIHHFKKLSNSWATANAKAMGLRLDAMARRRPNVRTTVASAVPRGEAPGSEQVVDTEEAREGS